MNTRCGKRPMNMRKDLWLLLAVVVAVASPTLLIIGNPSNLAALMLLSVLVWTGDRRSLMQFVGLLVLLLLLICASSLQGTVIAGGGQEINPSAFGPFMRIVICFFALRGADDPVRMLRRLLWIGACASAFAVSQYFSPTVAEFTSAHYLAPERSSVFTEDFSGESIVRVIGFYENPSSVGLLSIVMILFSLYAFSKGQMGRTALALFLIVHVAAGFLSLSKIFFGCLPLVLVQLVALRYRKSALAAFLLCLAGAAALYTLDDPLAEVIRYALSATLDPDIALKGRYLADQEAIISRSWLFGYGLVGTNEAIINDSAYLLTLYLLGLFGAVILASYVIWGLWSRHRRLPLTLHLVLLSILLAGIGANSILSIRVDILLAALCALLCSEISSIEIESSAHRSLRLINFQKRNNVDNSHSDLQSK
jgi:hypothetical protein